jgi:hypothetical protein
MASVFRAASGKVAVWDGEYNDLPFVDPLSNLARVKYHSDIEYIKIIDVKTFTLSIPAIASGVFDRVASYTLGPHGITGQPFIIGQIDVGGVPVAFTGSVPVHQAAPVTSVTPPTVDLYARWLALGVDATDVIVHEYAVQNRSQSFAGTPVPRPAQTFTVTVYITDIVL